MKLRHREWAQQGRRPATWLLLGLILSIACVTRDPREESVRPLPTVEPGSSVYGETRPGGPLEEIVSPQFHMAAARRELESGRRVGAADEVRKLAVFLGYEADRSAGERRRLIEESRLEVEALARQVSAGEVSSVDVLEQYFARVRAVLRR